MKASPLKDAFNAGEFSPLMAARVRIDKYQNALSVCENMIPMVQGGITRRPGTIFVSEVRDSSKATRLVPFEFSTTQAYMLEFGDQYIRFYKDHGNILEASQNISGITKANPGVLTYVGADPANGDWMYISGVVGMTQLNGRFVKVAGVNAGANTFNLTDIDGNNIDTSGYGTYTSGGTIERVYQVTSPYLEADLNELKFTQSADVLYITHPSYAPRKLSRTGHTSWTLSTIDFIDGPYLAVNTTATTIGASATTGTVTLTASANLFATTDVGRWVRLKVNSQWGWAKITAYTSATSVTATVSSAFGTGSATPVYKSVSTVAVASDVATIETSSSHGFSAGQLVTLSGLTTSMLNGSFYIVSVPSATSFTFSFTFVGTIATTSDTTGQAYTTVAAGSVSTADWRLGVWSDTTGWPSCSTFYEDRLFFSGAPNYPQRIDGSRSSNYETFSPTAADLTVTDSYAISFSLNSSDVNVVRWMIDDEKGLLIGTVGGEWILRPSSLSEALSATNATAKRSTAFGSADLQAIRAGRATIYIQRAGRKVRELAYVYEVDGFRSPDMTVLSEHVTKGGITVGDYQQEPWSIIWYIRGDGQIVGLTYERDQDVIGWHRHIIGGSFGSGNAIAESVGTIPNPDGTADEAWLIVKRTIDGVTRRYIEYIAPAFDDDTTTNAFFVDCGLTYTGAGVTTISGLDHLEGETVSILANGATHPDRTVVNGSITLVRSSTTVHVGLKYNSNAATLNIEAGSQDGTSQGKTKRIHRVTLRLYKTLGLKYGPNADNLDILSFRTAADDLGGPPALFTGDKTFNWNGFYETEGIVYFRQDQPLPFTLLGVFPQLVTQDR